MKKLLVAGICLISCIQLNASEREKREADEIVTISKVDYLFDEKPICPGFNCCGRHDCCGNNTVVAAVCGPTCTFLGFLGGASIGAALQKIKCMIAPQEDIWDRMMCIKDGNLPALGAAAGVGAGAITAIAVYSCCTNKTVRVVKKRNHDD